MDFERPQRRVNDDLLRKLWATALPDKELEFRLGHARSVLYRRAKTIGLPGRRVARIAAMKSGEPIVPNIFE